LPDSPAPCGQDTDCGPLLRTTFAGEKFRSRLHDAVIRVYDDAGNVIKTHEGTGELKEP
jgi:hypothetical protein